MVPKADGKQLNARVELLNAPNNPKQTFEVFTNNGELNRFVSSRRPTPQHRPHRQPRARGFPQRPAARSEGAPESCDEGDAMRTCTASERVGVVGRWWPRLSLFHSMTMSPSTNPAGVCACVRVCLCGRDMVGDG